ncbi:MAG: hypothetical protein JNL97_10370, partial [Verrucomicrobiales bacterium]|nr:hypothetical protein [Verrucomicrobiales bacterium]
LRNGAVTQSGDAKLRFNSSNQNYLDGMQVTGDLDLSAGSGRVRVRNGLTLNSGRVRLNDSGGIGFDGVQTFDGEIVFEGDSGFVSLDGTSTLTLAPSAFVHGKSGRIGQAIFNGGTSTLINQGRIRAEVVGGIVQVNPDVFTNTGTLESAEGGTLWVNARAATQGGTARVGTGKITFSGTLTQGLAAALVSAGGTLEASGIWDLGGGTLALNATTGGLLVNGGTLRNGAVTQTGDAKLRFSAGSQNYLDSMQVTGDLDLSAGASRARIRNGLTLNAGRVRLNENGAIGFDGVQTFGGEIVFEGDSGFVSLDGNATLTLAPTARIRGKSGRIGQAIFNGGTSTLINQGTIRADVAGGTLTVNPDTFTNTGTLEQANGGRLVAPGFP